MKDLYFGQGRMVFCSLFNEININDIKIKIKNYMGK